MGKTILFSDLPPGAEVEIVSLGIGFAWFLSVGGDRKSLITWTPATKSHDQSTLAQMQFARCAVRGCGQRAPSRQLGDLCADHGLDLSRTISGSMACKIGGEIDLMISEACKARDFRQATLAQWFLVSSLGVTKALMIHRVRRVIGEPAWRAKKIWDHLIG